MRRIVLLLAILSLTIVYIPVYAQSESVTCPGFMPSRLSVGANGRVAFGVSSGIRDQPTWDSVITDYIPSEATFTVLEGPVCSGNVAWWKVNYNGLVGWTNEGMVGDGYWLEPDLPCISQFQAGDEAERVSAVFIYAEPFQNYPSLIKPQEGDRFKILSEPVCRDEQVWVQVQYQDITGWIAEVGYVQCDAYCPDHPVILIRHPFVPLPAPIPVSEAASLLSPAPQIQPAENAISSANADQVEQIGGIGEGSFTNLTWILDEDRFVVTTSVDFRLYDVKEMTEPFYRLTHTGGIVRAITHRFDGILLATAAVDGTLNIWDIQTSTRIATIERNTAIQNLMFSPDGKSLASLSSDEGVSIYNISQPSVPVLRYQWETSLPFYRSLTFTSDTKTLVVVDTGQIRVYDLISGNFHVIPAFDAPDGGNEILKWAISPDNRQIVALIIRREGDVAQSNSVYVKSWMIDTGLPGNYALKPNEFSQPADTQGSALIFKPGTDELLITTGNEHILLRNESISGRYDAGYTVSSAFSRDGKLIAFGYRDGSIQLYSGFDLLDVLYGTQGTVLSLDFSPDGRYLAASGIDRTLRVWDMTTRQRLGTIETIYSGRNFILSPDEQQILFVNEGEIHEMNSGTLIQNIDLSLGQLLVFADEHILVTSASVDQKQYYKVFNVHQNPPELITSIDYCDYYKPVVSPDGSLFICQPIRNSENAVEVRDLRTGNILQSFKRYFRTPWQLLFSPDNRLLSVLDYGEQGNSAKHEKTLSIWHVASGQLLFKQTLDSRLNRYIYTVFSPDSHKLAWIIVHPSNVNAGAALSPTEVHVIDFVTREQSKIILDTEKDQPELRTAFAFNGDASMLMMGRPDGKIDLLDIYSGKIIRTLEGHAARITQLYLTREGTRLYSASEDGTLRIWGIPSD